MLKSVKPRGGGGEAKKEVMRHLDESIKYLHHIFQDTHNLKKDYFYDRINALTLEEFLQKSLENNETSLSMDYSYDFRTVELARLLFEISVLYLEKNPYLKVNEELPSEIKRSIINISEYFKMLSNDLLEKENHKIMTDKKKSILIKKIDDMKGVKEKLNQEYSDLVKEKNTEAKIRAADFIANDFGKISKLKEKINEITWTRSFANELIDIRILKLTKKLSHTYNHPSNVFCPLKRHNLFEYQENPHLEANDPENNYIGL